MAWNKRESWDIGVVLPDDPSTNLIPLSYPDLMCANDIVGITTNCEGLSASLEGFLDAHGKSQVGVYVTLLELDGPAHRTRASRHSVSVDTSLPTGGVISRRTQFCLSPPLDR